MKIITFLLPQCSRQLPLLLFVGACTLLPLANAQAQSNLSDPKLQANGSLPQHNLGHRPIQQKLQLAHAQATSQGIPWKGLTLIAPDEEAASPYVPLATMLLQVYQEKETCQADAIVVGHTTASVSRLSAYGTDIYSDYIFTIDSVLKDNPASPVRSRPDIVVTRPGGELTLPDGHVTQDEQSFPRLQPGVTYLQFLKYIPQSTAYRAIDAFSTLVQGPSNWTIARQRFSGTAVAGFTLTGIGPTIASWLASCQ